MNEKALQIMIDDLIPKDEPVEVVLPVAQSYDRAFTIPDDVWETRCKLCIHKNGAENWSVPFWAVHKQQYSELIPCRIISICQMNDMSGECMSFSPRMDVYGICETCRHNNIFEDGFCMKEDHAEQRRVFYGKDFGGDERKRDYYGRHRLSVCDDYEPDAYVRGGT